MKRRLKDMVCLAAVGAIVALFYWRTIILGVLPVPSDALVGLYHPWRDQMAGTYERGYPFKNPLITDPVRQQIPWRKLVVESYKNGRLPGWDATVFSGASLAFNVQSGAFYPLNVLFFVFPFSVAWTLLIVSQTLGMMVFTYLYLRGRRLHTYSSLFGSVIAAFSGFSVAWLTWGTIVSSFMWVPLALFAVDRISEKKHGLSAAGLLVVCGLMMATAGHTQIAFYGAGMIAAYAAYRIVAGQGKMRNRMLLVIGLAAVCLAVLVFPFVWGYMGVVGQSVRMGSGASWKEAGFFIPVVHLVQFFVPDFFGNPTTLNYWGTWNYGELVGFVGVIGLLFALMGFAASWKDKAFWIWVVVVGLVFAVDSPLSRLPYVLGLPFLSSLQPTRLLVVVCFGLAVCSSHGIEKFAEGEVGKKISMRIFVGFAAVYLILSGIIRFRLGMSADHAAVSFRNFVLPAVFAVVGIGASWCMDLREVRRRRLVKVFFELLVFGGLLVDLLRFGWKFTPFTPPELFFPETPIVKYLESDPEIGRVLPLDDRIFPPDVLSYYGIQTVGGYDPVYSGRYARFLQALDGGAPAALNTPSFIRIVAPKNVVSPLTRYLNIRYLVAFRGMNVYGGVEVAHEGQTVLYRNDGSLPRFYLADRVSVSPTFAGQIAEMEKESDGFPGVVGSPLDVVSVPLTASEKVAVRSYRSGLAVLDVVTGAPRLLVFGETFDGNWRVSVDGKPGSVVPVNALFMGVKVPVGNHTVRFDYRPFFGL